MINDINIIFIFLKYKINVISKKKLFEEVREYVKSKGQIFIKLLQIFLSNKYTFGKNITEEEFNELNLILDHVYTKIEGADFDVGCGSVAYVKFDEDDNSKVIKKKIPNIKDQIINSTEEFKKMIFLANLSYGLNFDNNSIDEYKELLLKQTDLNREAIDMLRMREIFKDEEYINIPKIYYFDDDNIKMDYIEGYKLSYFVEKYPNRKEFCKMILQRAFQIMIQKKLFHGDFHEGNFLFSINKDLTATLNIIDFGIVFELSNYQKIIYSDYLMNNKNMSKFYYELSDKNISFEIFDKHFEKHLENKSDTFQIIDDLKNNNVIFNFYYTTFLIGIGILKTKVRKLC